MKNRLIASAFVLLGFWALISTSGHASSKSCINVYVNYGLLSNDKTVLGCIDANGKTNALQLLQKSGFKLEGTQKYGLQVVCRVDNLPTPATENCLKMPPENAYWALIVKNKRSIKDPMPKWGWSQTGISTLYLYPGDSVGLVFTVNNKVKWPN